MHQSLIVLFFLQIFGAHSLIVPDEIPTILSVIYSNIPVLKKGTDSRIGWGFRLGNRADFQVLVELGPQTYTQPLANQEDKNSNNKRNTVDSLSNTLYAQRQQEKQNNKDDGANWLETWSENIKKQKLEQNIPIGAKPGLAEGEIDAKSVIPDDEHSNTKPQEIVKPEELDFLVKKLKELSLKKKQESENVKESEKKS